MAKVFVGIPTYNRPDFVRESIDSLRTQSFSDFRVLVSDNRSSPEATDAVRAYVAALNDRRFAFHLQAVNQGEYGQGRRFMADSMNEEMFVILHDDDILAPQYLEVAVAALDAAPQADLFTANFYMMDQNANRLDDLTAWRQRALGRIGTPNGLFDVRTGHVMTGFTPISGTLFRRAALVRSGFADPERVGNYPFECDIFLRLGDIEAKGWFDDREMVGVRDHPRSLKSNMELMDNPHIVTPMLEMFGRRRYTGRLERRRRILMSRLARADALIRLRRSDRAGFRRMLLRAIRENPASPRAWILSLAALAAPDVVRRRLPPVQTIRDVDEIMPSERA